MLAINLDKSATILSDIRSFVFWHCVFYREQYHSACSPRAIVASFFMLSHNHKAIMYWITNMKLSFSNIYISINLSKMQNMYLVIISRFPLVNALISLFLRRKAFLIPGASWTGNSPFTGVVWEYFSMHLIENSFSHEKQM